MSNISSLVNVDWYLGKPRIPSSSSVSVSLDARFEGIPWNDTTNWRLDVVKAGQEILGDRVLGFQAANEPDLFVAHGHRPEARSVSTLCLLRRSELFALGIWSRRLQGGSSECSFRHARPRSQDSKPDYCPQCQP